MIKISHGSPVTGRTPNSHDLIMRQIGAEHTAGFRRFQAVYGCGAGTSFKMLGSSHIIVVFQKPEKLVRKTPSQPTAGRNLAGSSSRPQKRKMQGEQGVSGRSGWSREKRKIQGVSSSRERKGSSFLFRKFQAEQVVTGGSGGKRKSRVLLP